MKRASPKTDRRKLSIDDLPDAAWFDGRASVRLDECARALRVSERRLLDLIAEGAFPSIDGVAFKKLPPLKRRIPIAAWQQFLLSHSGACQDKEAAK